MATPLPAKIVIKNGEHLSATADHVQFRLTARNGEPPAMVTEIVLGVLNANGGFDPIPGIRQDTQQPAQVRVEWTQPEYDAFAALPEVQVALGKAKQMHDWIAGGREGAPPF